MTHDPEHGSEDARLRRALSEIEPAAPFPRHEIQERIEATMRRREAAAPSARGRLGRLLRALLGGRSARGGEISGIRRPLLRGLVAAAASLLIFVAGVEYGRRIATAAPAGAAAGSDKTVGTADTGQDMAAMTVPLAIQERGTAFVSDLSRLSESLDSMSAEEIDQARQVAAAVLYGAALELLELDPHDAATAALAESLRQRRRTGDDRRMLVWQ